MKKKTSKHNDHLRLIYLVFYSLFCFLTLFSPRVAASGIDRTPISVYEDNYLLTGFDDSSYTGGAQLKFQISAKLQLAQSPLHIAYTQRSFMDLISESFPFYDHNFRPELFYAKSTRGWLKGWQVGFAHESNGREDPSSRSWNYLYARGYFKFGLFYLRPQIHFPFLLDDQNKNFREYRGYVQWAMGYVFKERSEFSLETRVGGKFDRGLIILNASLPWENVFKNLNYSSATALWLQFTQGYGEALLGYDQNNWNLTLGLGIRG